MFKFVLNKMLNKKWMVLSLLIGNILLISIACVNPMYTQAVLQRMLTRNLAEYMDENNRYPGTITVSAALNVRDGVASNRELFDQARDNYLSASEWYNVPLRESVEHYYLANATASYDVVRNDKQKTVSMQLGALSDMEAHSALVGGRMYSDTLADDGTIEVVVSQSAMVKLDLLLDETLTLKTYKTADGEPLRVKVVGVFKNSAPDDVYWVRTPAAYSNEVFMSKALFDEMFASGEGIDYPVTSLWYILLDYEQMRGDCAQDMYDLTCRLEEQFGDMYSFRFTAVFKSTLASYLVKANQVDTTLWVLQVPILVLLCAFIFMVSRQMLQLDEGMHFLGECALVPMDSPIARINTLFYKTLFDENASCHLALGDGMSECVQGGLEMTQEQLLAAGVNSSLSHTDFMFGTPDLSITGRTSDGREIPIMQNGLFTGELA